MNSFIQGFVKEAKADGYEGIGGKYLRDMRDAMPKIKGPGIPGKTSPAVGDIANRVIKTVKQSATDPKGFVRSAYGWARK